MPIPFLKATIFAPASLVALAAIGQCFAQTADPEVPPGIDPAGVAVAIIDTGVNYTLPSVASRLARNRSGQILGYDFEDEDESPFDLAPGQSGIRAKRHGTSVASILLREAPAVRLIPYRYKANDFSSFARIVGRIAQGPAKIVSISLGGYNRKDWELFLSAVNTNPEILFIISAGNDGRDIDNEPVYPAAFKLPNALTVTSTDAFGRLTPDSNWGVNSVDISTPGERIETINHKGETVRVSGSSFAVPRIAALAARLKAKDKTLSTTQIIKAIVSRTRRSPRDRTKRVKYGWIPNPAED